MTGSIFSKNKLKNIACDVKRGKKGALGACNAYVWGPDAAAHGRTQFHSRILIKKRSDPQRESTR